MTLPKAPKKKLIEEKKFAKIAEQVKKSLEQEAKYLIEKKLENGNKISSRSYSLS